MVSARAPPVDALGRDVKRLTQIEYEMVRQVFNVAAKVLTFCKIYSDGLTVGRRLK